MTGIAANIVFFTLLFANNSLLFGQDTDVLRSYRHQYKEWRKTEVFTGISWQQSRGNQTKSLRYGEIGIAKSLHNEGYHGPVSLGIYVAEELYFGKERNVYGTKAGLYMHWLFDIGTALIYYTDFKKGNFKIRPEFGFGMGPIRLVAGYNIPTINNKAFEVLQKNYGQVSIQYLIPVKKKEVAEKEKNIFRRLFKK